MRIALLTTDNRENYRRYELDKPYFGTAPEGLIEGFSKVPDLEVHVISCTQRVMASPSKLAENIWFHSLPVPKSGWLRTSILRSKSSASTWNSNWSLIVQAMVESDAEMRIIQ